MKTQSRILASVILLLVSSAFVDVMAQDETVKLGQSTIYLESLGNYNRHAISFDQFFSDNVSVRVGVGTGGVADVKGPTASFMVNYMLGQIHKLELSFGYAAPMKQSGYGTATFIGYRYQPKESGISVRFAVNPSLSGQPLGSFGGDSNYNGMQIAFGYSF